MSNDLEVYDDVVDLEAYGGNVYVNYVDDFTAATSTAEGEHGLVPAPPRGYARAVLFGDANWWSLDNVLQLAPSATSAAVNFVRQRVGKTSSGNPTVIVDTLDSVTIPAATKTTAGLMSAEDKGNLETLTTEGMQEFVNEWLEEHPEATTTVQDDSLTTDKYKDGSITTLKLADGSVTLPKLSSALAASIPMSPLTDAEIDAITEA